MSLIGFAVVTPCIRVLLGPENLMWFTMIFDDYRWQDRLSTPALSLADLGLAMVVLAALGIASFFLVAPALASFWSEPGGLSSDRGEARPYQRRFRPYPDSAVRAKPTDAPAGRSEQGLISETATPFEAAGRISIHSGGELP
jgi:hypothetical protein